MVVDLSVEFFVVGSAEGDEVLIADEDDDLEYSADDLFAGDIHVCYHERRISLNIIRREIRF